MDHLKKTKIVATLGPASSDPQIIEQLILQGVNTFRLNFSHGTYEGHARIIREIKKIRKKHRLPVAILQDLQGPKIRVGEISEGGLVLRQGDVIVLDTQISVNAGNRIPVSYPDFANDVQPGHRLLLADGDIQLMIKSKTETTVTCEVLAGGQLSSHKGINYPDGSFHLPAVTPKDEQDLEFGLKNEVDFIALSFVRSAKDIRIAHLRMEKFGKRIPLIAKIEKHEAIDNFDEILNEVDGVMVARGDLGVEIPIEKVPMVQKKIIHACNLAGKPVITATQMLRSMVNSPTPTRAEVTDVANAILDGTDAIMLSEETAVGKYPVETVEMMSRIAREVEMSYPYFKSFSRDKLRASISIPEAISHNASVLSEEIKSNLIICPTTSGFTARSVARFRPRARILALTPQESTFYQLALVWNVYPHLLHFEDRIDLLFDHALKIAYDQKMLKKGESYVVTAGFPFGVGGFTNLIKAGVYE